MSYKNLAIKLVQIDPYHWRRKDYTIAITSHLGEPVPLKFTAWHCPGSTVKSSKGCPIENRLILSIHRSIFDAAKAIKKHYSANNDHNKIISLTELGKARAILQRGRT